MTKENQHELFETVLSFINTYDRESAERRIWDAHMGNPDGRLVTNENMHLFRQYRNSIDPNPVHMVDSALAYQLTAWDQNNGHYSTSNR